MTSLEQLSQNIGGHDFSNHARNVLLQGGPPTDTHARDLTNVNAHAHTLSACGDNIRVPPFTKTGTTICGVVFNGGVVLGADTRATQGPIVADANCDKLHRLSNSMFAAGAGTAADLDHMCEWLANQIELHRLRTDAQPRVAMAVSVMSQELYKYQGHKGCALVLGGVDVHGASLYKLHPHGSTDFCKFAAMGSGSLNALAILESGFRDDLTEDSAKELVASAITAGIKNDLASGGSVDICVITSKGHTHTRKFKEPIRVYPKVKYPPYAIGTTPIFSQHIEVIKQLVDISTDVEMSEAA